MQKIPLQSNPSDEAERELAPRFLMQVLEILLLGALWLFVLVWMPFYAGQDEAGVSELVYKTHWLTVTGLAMVLLAILWMQRVMFPVMRMQWLMLALVCISGVGMLALMSMINVIVFAELVCIIQAVLGLVYFAVSRTRSL